MRVTLPASETAVAQYQIRPTIPRWWKPASPLVAVLYGDGRVEIHEVINEINFVLLTIPASERVET